MEKYKVLVFLHKLSEGKDYNENDIISLPKEDAEPLLKEGKISKLKNK